MRTKETPETVACLQRFLIPIQKPGIVNTDRTKEFVKACQALQLNHDTSFIAQKQTEWQKEPVRKVKRGTSIALVQSGLPEAKLDCAMYCHCYLRNSQDRLADGLTAFEKIFGQTLAVIPFGASVEYIPITAKEASIVHQFGNKMLKGTFLGSVLRAGGRWSGDLMLAGCQELQESEAAEVYVKRFKNQEKGLTGKQRDTSCESGTEKYEMWDGTQNVEHEDRSETMTGPFKWDLVNASKG